MASRQRATWGDIVTHVVVGRDWRVVEPVEAYLEHLRQEEYSPNTVRAYAGGLATWWSMLEDADLDWQRIGVSDIARFTRRLASRGRDPSVIELRASGPPPASMINCAVSAVLGFYRYHALVGAFRRRSSSMNVYMEARARRGAGIRLC
jgi:hypothetical protein